MLEKILDFSSISSSVMTWQNTLVCSVISIALGVGVALVYMYKSSYSKSFVVTLVVLPAIVQTVIMLVNGNLGTSVAVLGAFGLVRFRSAQGSAKEIGSIFFAMAIGLATGMGYISYAVMFFLVIGGIMLLLTVLHFGDSHVTAKSLKIVIPESLDFDGIFDDLLKSYTDKCRLVKVKTTNMGSLFELNYEIELKRKVSEKKFIDEIRCRNGNLSISLGRAETAIGEL